MLSNLFLSYLYLIIAFILSGQAAKANPQIDVGEMYSYIESDKISVVKHVFNSGGGSDALVRVDVLEILFTVNGLPIEIPIKNPRQSLIATPNRFFVPVGDSRGIRLAFLGKRDHERYFRVRFKPLIPEKSSNFEAAEDKYGVSEKAPTVSVNLLVGYGTVLFVRPADTVFNTLINEDVQSYIIENQGNSVVIIDAFTDCPQGKRALCKPATKHHLLPGKDFKFGKLLGHEYRFTLIEGSSVKDVIVRG